MWRGDGEFWWGRDFFIRWRKSGEEWFWLFKPFSRLKTTLCKCWTSTKPKLEWPVSTNTMKLKWKWYRRNDYWQKWSFYWVITWKLLFSWRDKNLVGGSFVRWKRMNKLASSGGGSFFAHDVCIFKGKSRISKDIFNKINLSILQFNIVNFQMKQFIVFLKFLWNSI